MSFHDLFSLEGNVAVVTGGAGYLGSRMVEALLGHGASVVVGDVADLPKMPPDVASTGRLLHLRCDVSSTQSIRRMFQESRQYFGHVDILINNACYGAGYGSTEIESMSDEMWMKGLDGAVGTTFRCTREAVPYLRERGGGTIVNIASMYGMVSPDPGMYGSSGANNPPNYGVGKSGVIQLTRYSAAHLAVHRIRVNCVSPGPFPNPDFGYEAWFMKNMEDKTMLKRTGRPHEIAGAVLFLASSASDYVTGINVPVDGGWTAW